MTPRFTPEELDYLRGQPLGRLATVDGSGEPQNNLVGFLIDEDAGQVLIGSLALASTRKSATSHATSTWPLSSTTSPRSTRG